MLELTATAVAMASLACGMDALDRFPMNYRTLNLRRTVVAGLDALVVCNQDDWRKNDGGGRLLLADIINR